MTLSPTALESRVPDLVAAIAGQLVEVRRALHVNPETAFEERETAAFLSGHLEQAGIPHRTGIGRTGIVARIGAGRGPVIALRGDMDALPVAEATGLPFASRRPGVMHACGHDAHAAIALGVALVMAKLAPELPGDAVVIFQPAEESLGGAAAMLADGLLEWARPAAMLGFHNWPLLPVGEVGWHPEAAFASSDGFDIVVRGSGGHGAHPHLAVDPVVAAAHLVTELQMIVSREIAPVAAAVLSVGRITGGTVRNQIPDQVRLEGTIRTLAAEVRDHVRAAVERVARGVSLSHRVDCVVEFVPGTPVMRNDSEVLEVLVGAARDALGDGRVRRMPSGSMGSEDFAEFSSRLPAAHLRIGSAIAGRTTMLHRSDFDLDEGCLPVAVDILARAMLRLMARETR